jgi:hypothetical protein
MGEHDYDSEFLDNIMDAKGTRRDLIEVTNIKRNTELAVATLKKIKSEFWFNILYIVVGFVLGLLPTIMSESKEKVTIELLNILAVERSEQQKRSEIDAQKMRSEISFLKRELDSLKVYKPYFENFSENHPLKGGMSKPE